MVRLFVLSLLTIFSANAFAAEKLECALKDGENTAVTIAISIDGDKATVSADKSTSDCKLERNQKEISAAETMLTGDSQEKISLKHVVLCEGKTGDETLSYLVTNNKLDEQNTNTLVISPAVGVVLAGTCK